eukprot:14394050-Alexandrium_andersonii.AAC.1
MNACNEARAVPVGAVELLARAGPKSMPTTWKPSRRSWGQEDRDLRAERGHVEVKRQVDGVRTQTFARLRWDSWPKLGTAKAEATNMRRKRESWDR